MADPLPYASPPPRRVRGWQFLSIAAMVAFGVLVLGFARMVVGTKLVPKPTTAPTYGAQQW